MFTSNTIMTTVLILRIYVYTPTVEELQPPEINESIREIDGNEIPMLGKVTVPIGLRERRSSRTVWVVARIEENCILGTDFLKEGRCVFDYPNCALRLRESEIP